MRIRHVLSFTSDVAAEHPLHFRHLLAVQVQDAVFDRALHQEPLIDAHLATQTGACTYAWHFIYGKWYRPSGEL